MGAFDDLLPEGEVQSSGMFDDLLPEKKGSYFSGDQGFIPDVAEDIGKGMYSGVVSVPQGIAEAAAIGIDLVLDSDTASTVTEAFEYIKPELGTAGAVTEDLVAFGAGFIPIAGWLGKAGQAAKAVNSGKKLSTAAEVSSPNLPLSLDHQKLGARPSELGLGWLDQPRAQQVFTAQLSQQTVEPPCPTVFLFSLVKTS